MKLSKKQSGIVVAIVVVVGLGVFFGNNNREKFPMEFYFPPDGLRDGKLMFLRECKGDLVS